jgi:multiple sugar transport system substrate-binding protein
VRSLALFYNKKAFKDAGLDPNNPPKTVEELVAAAEKTVKRDGSGNIVSAGMTLDMGGQDHQWWREVLIRQFGGAPYTENDTKVAYNDDAGLKALTFYTDLQKKHKVGQAGFMDEGQAAFRAGLAAMTIDGTFRLGSFGTIKTFESSPEAMKVWMEVVGELPARRDVALTPENVAHPVYGPFLKGLEYAHTTLFKDEAAQRQVAIDMANRVLIGGEDPKTSLAKAAEAEQAIIDRAKR